MCSHMPVQQELFLQNSQVERHWQQMQYFEQLEFQLCHLQYVVVAVVVAVEVVAVVDLAVVVELAVVVVVPAAAAAAAAVVVVVLVADSLDLW